MEVFTIGHSNHPIGRLLELLARHHLQTLIDVRRYPVSKRWPHFARRNLAPELAAAGIDYHWFECLGGHRDPSLDVCDSPNYGITNESFRNYADYMLDDAFRAGVARLTEMAATSKTTLMCAEAQVRHCHRRLLCDYLLARGIEVLHIQADGNLLPHKLTEDAAMADGTVTYPGPKTLFD